MRNRQKIEGEMRHAIAVWMTDQMSACEDVFEQQILVEQFVGVAIGIWTYRFKNVDDQLKDEAVALLREYVDFQIDHAAIRIKAKQD